MVRGSACVYCQLAVDLAVMFVTGVRTLLTAAEDRLFAFYSGGFGNGANEVVGMVGW